MEWNRRNFARPLLGAAALAPVACAATPEAPPKVTLPGSGITLSRLGFGTGVRSGRKRSEMTKKGFAAFVDLFRHCYDRGITFFDLADWYGSHPYCREALRHIPREDVAIMTKFWFREDGDVAKCSVAHRRKSAEKALARYRYELQTDYIDMLLLHCLKKPDWVEEMTPYMEVFSEAKTRGELKAVGVSCHDFGAMKTAVETPWVDIMLARLNPQGVMCDAQPEEVCTLLAKARAKGKAVIGMKIYGEGRLVDERDACMKYAQTNGVLDAMTIGAVSPEEVDDNLRLMSKYPVVKRRYKKKAPRKRELFACSERND